MDKTNRKTIDQLLLLALVKASTEHSTLLIGEYKFKPKMLYKAYTHLADEFVEEIEKVLTTEERELLTAISDSIHDIIKDVRKQI